MIHRALAGSFERFFAFAIEHHGGKFPLWYAPKQIRICPISDKFIDYANKVNNLLRNEGEKFNLWIRSDIDNRPETLQAKIRDAEIEKIPYVLVVGGRDEKNNEVSIRVRGLGDQGAISFEIFKEKFIKEIQEKKLSLWE